MTTRRLFVPPSLRSGALSLEPEAAHYLSHVLRLRVGARLQVGDGEGRFATAEVTQSGLQVDTIQQAEDPTPPHITLLQGVGKGDKLDLVVRQAVELGVCRLQPVLTERSVARRSGKLDRWRTIAEDAMRVSARWHRPRIDPACALDDALAHGSDQALVFAAHGAPLGAVLDLTAERTTILIGPEGGLSDAELERAEAAGFRSVHLGKHTLRTETAGPAAVAVLRFASGAFDRERGR